MDKALRYELVKVIPELDGEIYPTNAPETSSKPYLVYAILNDGRVKTLNGYTEDQGINYMYNVMATRYEDMSELAKQVEKLLLSIPKTYIGEDTAIFVEDITINNIKTVYEFDLKVNRRIIDFTIYF